MIPKRAKAHDMRFSWLKCREAQKMFDLTWKKGKDNKADYHIYIYIYIAAENILLDAINA
jgi:hypothetical protein